MVFSSRVYTEIEINAAVEQVWHVITDFDSYPLWMPFRKGIHLIPRLTVSGQDAEALDLHLYFAKVRIKAVRTATLDIVPNRELRWIACLLNKYVFAGDHVLYLEPLGESRMRLVQRETYTGILAPLWRLFIQKIVRGKFSVMNSAIKSRAENMQMLREELNS